ncbi:uncharacterized protein ACN2A1_010274 [Glossina fuscipes fuscipes]
MKVDNFAKLPPLELTTAPFGGDLRRMAECNTSEQGENNLFHQHRFYGPPISNRKEIKNYGQFERRQQQKWEPENTTTITKARPPKGKQRNYSDSNILRARKAGKALVEIELSRKHQLNCVIKALAIAEK